MNNEDNYIESFKKYHRQLFGIAYRMLGSRFDAEDVVQETYLRRHKAQNKNIESEEAWLVTVATRLAIDRLRLLKKERETYIGPWLPDPIATQEENSGEENLNFTSSLSLAFLSLLEKLSPVERAAFLLYEVFDFSYAEIAHITGKSEVTCRQMIHRARERVKNEKRRFRSNEAERVSLIKKFAAAVSSSDKQAIVSLLAEDAVMITDGGGKVEAARKIVEGAHKIANMYYHLAEKAKGVWDYCIVPINGDIGIVPSIFGQPFAATVFETENEKIIAIYQVMNPDKLSTFFKEISKELKK